MCVCSAIYSINWYVSHILIGNVAAEMKGREDLCLPGAYVLVGKGNTIQAKN